jgi:hypothetical protein
MVRVSQNIQVGHRVLSEYACYGWTYVSLTALLMEARLFQRGAIPLPASRFVCEHLHQNLFRACTSRIHAQVPVITTGQLAKSPAASRDSVTRSGRSTSGSGHQREPLVSC